MEKDHRADQGVESGGTIGAPLEDYWKEFNTFEEGTQTEDDEEDFSKTPDEGEVEEEWLREAGFETIVDSELTEQDEAEFYEDLLATLTARQIAVVKRRLDTVQMSKKRRHPRTRQRADVRELFGSLNASPPQSLTPLRSDDPPCPEPECAPADRWSCLRGEQGQTRTRTPVLPPLPFLRSGHSGGFSLGDPSRGIDCESPTSVEVLKYETRTSVINDNSVTKNGSSNGTSHEPHSLETGFQEISSRMNSIADLTDAEKDLALLQRNCHVQLADLGDADRTLVRSLAIIEVAALLDTYGLVPSRRRKPNRKKGKENVIFGASLTTLLESDRRRCPGSKIPLIYQWILHHLHTNGLREEGLMRLGGSIQKTQFLKAEIERSYFTSPILLENLIHQSSVHDVSVLLKQLVRQLPEPLLTNSHMDAFLQVPNIPNVQDQINTLNLLVLALPDVHREVLQELLYFLAQVVTEEDANRMSLANVAMVMAPNFFPPPRLKKGSRKGSDLATEVTVAAMSSKVTQMLIRYGHLLGAVPSELLAQARLQNRRSSNKFTKKVVGRKLKVEKQKISKEESPQQVVGNCGCVIRVQVASLRPPNSVAVGVGERTTAGEVVEKVAEAMEQRLEPRIYPAQPCTEQQENRALLQRPRTTSEPLSLRQSCLIGAKKPVNCLKDHFLYIVRENVGERRLDHSNYVLSSTGSGSSRLASGSTWEIRCHH